jgi:4-amino-4-deoxy-L-arabinose transferase-like glycosyltransferase
MKDVMEKLEKLLEFCLVGLIGVVSLCWGLALNGGFQGYDDLHYLQAAQNWLQNGPSLPTEHWAGRLPFVLLLVVGMKLFGVNSSALIVVNSLLLLIVIGTTWWIARLKFDSRSAIFAALLAGATPLFFRLPQTFYPEALEVALFGLEFGLVIIALRSPSSAKSYRNSCRSWLARWRCFSPPGDFSGHSNRACLVYFS